MPHYTYLIVGGGMTADAAVRGIREVDDKGSIGMIAAEHDAPYDRPPLTKGLWKGRPMEKIWRDTQNRAVDLILGSVAEKIDPADHSVMDNQGRTYSYDRLLLATGGTPRHLPFGGDDIIYYRTLDHYRRLRALTEERQRFGVIGAGFIGSELAAALRMNGKDVVMVFPERHIGERIYPPDLAGFVTEYYREKGVQVLNGHSLTGVERRGGLVILRARGGQGQPEDEVVVDAVVAGLGITPNTDLARQAGLQVEDGILVDEFLRTSHPDIYAAGDVASFFNPALGKRLRVEHEDNANTMGQRAGRAMAGQPVAYDYLPFFYSDLFELGYEAVGETDSRLETVEDWQEQFRKGVVYYLRGGRVRGVLLWNVWEQVNAARKLIAEPGPFDAGNLRGRLPAKT